MFLYEGAHLLQQHDCLHSLCSAVNYNPATVTSAERKSTLERIKHQRSLEYKTAGSLARTYFSTLSTGERPIQPIYDYSALKTKSFSSHLSTILWWYLAHLAVVLLIIRWILRNLRENTKPHSSKANMNRSYHRHAISETIISKLYSVGL